MDIQELAKEFKLKPTDLIKIAENNFKAKTKVTTSISLFETMKKKKLSVNHRKNATKKVLIKKDDKKKKPRTYRTYKTQKTTYNSSCFRTISIPRI